jgi:hypothetical protein
MYRLKVSPTRTAELRYASGRTELLIDGRVEYTTSATVRLTTDRAGRIRSSTGIDGSAVRPALTHASGRTIEVAAEPNVTRAL